MDKRKRDFSPEDERLIRKELYLCAHEEIPDEYDPSRETMQRLRTEDRLEKLEDQTAKQESIIENTKYALYAGLIFIVIVVVGFLSECAGISGDGY